VIGLVQDGDLDRVQVVQGLQGFNLHQQTHLRIGSAITGNRTY
jgi:hypothetical protein